MLRKGWLLNNPVTLQDYKNALAIYREDLGVLKWKTRRKKPNPVSVDTVIKIEMRKILLGVDLFFTGLTFLITVSRDFRFITATLLTDRCKQTILTALQQVMKLYHGRGHLMETIEFIAQSNPVYTILAGNEFQILREELEYKGVQVNIVSKDEHVPEVERQNRVIKERARAIIQMLPYTTMPKWMRGALINYVVYWLNCMPKEGQDSSPREMVMGGPKLEYKKMCRLLFGAYVQVHNNNLVINTMESRTTGAVNLGPTGNTQEGHWFLN